MDLKVMKNEIDELNSDILKLEKELKNKIKTRNDKRVELKTELLIKSKDSLREDTLRKLIEIEEVEIMVM